MSFTYDPTNNVGEVRLWIADTVSASAIFTDEEIGAMLTKNDNDPKQTAAALLLCIASDRARLAKKKSAGKYSEDLTYVAKELREQAKAILEGLQIPYDAVVEQTFEDVTQTANRFDDKGAREFIEKEHIRGEDI